MPAHRKPRPQTEEALRAAVEKECLRRLGPDMVAALQNLRDEDLHWQGRKERKESVRKLCRVAYGTIENVTTELRRRELEAAYMSAFAVYQGLREKLAELEALCVEQKTHKRHFPKEAGRLVEAMRTDFLPLSRFAKSMADHRSWEMWRSVYETRRSWTKRKIFIFLLDTPEEKQPPRAELCWGLGRAATNTELALIAILAGDSPPLKVGKDTVAGVIRRMTSIMAAERRRLWIDETNGRFNGPKSIDEQQGKKA